MFLGGLALSCRPASYEILRPKKGTADNGPPPSSSTVPPVSQPPVGPSNLPPTARVEVIWNGSPVTKVQVNQPVQVRPSYDTVDPDYIGKSNCANPGITRADYDIGHQATPTAQRTQGCEDLAVPYTFTQPGDYQVSMVVTSQDNQQATASMTLHVVDANTPLTDNGGFTITADPLLSSIGQPVTFIGYCQTSLPYTITWQFGDNSTGTGVTVVHNYAAAGQYRLDATCTEQSGRTWLANVTEVVLTQQVVIPGSPTGHPIPPFGGIPTTLPGDPTQQIPGQVPGQIPVQIPGQIPATPIYQPTCGCSG